MGSWKGREVIFCFLLFFRFAICDPFTKTSSRLGKAIELRLAVPLCYSLEKFDFMIFMHDDIRPRQHCVAGMSLVAIPPKIPNLCMSC